MILFIRHAESLSNAFNRSTLSNWVDFNHKDPKLTPVGRGQAKEAGQFLNEWLKDNDKKIKNIYVSPMTRTMETAGLIFSEVEAPKPAMVLIPDLREHHTISIAEHGTDKTDLFNLLADQQSPLKNFTVDTSLVTEEIWYATEYETDDIINARIKLLHDRYIDKSDIDDNADDVTIIVSHSGIGFRLLNLKTNMDNADIIAATEKGTIKDTIFSSQYYWLNPPPDDFIP